MVPFSSPQLLADYFLPQNMYANNLTRPAVRRVSKADAEMNAVLSVVRCNVSKSAGHQNSR